MVKNIIDSFSATTGDTIVKHITTSNNISVLPFYQISDEQLITDIHVVKTSVHTSIQDKINELDKLIITDDRDDSSILSEINPDVVVVVFLPRPMEGMGRLQFSDLFSQNCQFHHRRLESLEHLMCLIYILLSTTVSHFFDLTDAFFFFKVSSFYLLYISILQVHFACVLCI